MSSSIEPLLDNDEAVLAVVEALRGYLSDHASDGLSHEVLVERWFQEQLFRPSAEEFARAVRLMQKTKRGHVRVPGGLKRA
ncbi:MAG: hypothetical protein AB8G16_12590 [Gammaproteobacteria bacterium]